MSLILDALRKSDVERSRQQAPQVAGAAAAAAPTRERRWLVPVLALLSVNAALLAWVLLRPSAEPLATAAPAATTAPAAAITRNEPAIATRRMPPPDKAPVESLAEASADTGLRAAPATRPAAVAETAATPTASEPEPLMQSAQPAASAPVRAPIELPDARALADDGIISADALAMELHYYADASERRFAFIGGRKVGGGDTLGNGVRVAEVVRDGVVLEHRGRRYMLHRD